MTDLNLLSVSSAAGPHSTTTALEDLASVMPAWMADAPCASADPEAWFPNPGVIPTYAKRVCATCPVRRKCLDYAIARNERSGVWGGLTTAERRRLIQEKP